MKTLGMRLLLKLTRQYMGSGRSTTHVRLAVDPLVRCPPAARQEGLGSASTVLGRAGLGRLVEWRSQDRGYCSACPELCSHLSGGCTVLPAFLISAERPHAPDSNQQGFPVLPPTPRGQLVEPSSGAGTNRTGRDQGHLAQVLPRVF